MALPVEVLDLTSKIAGMADRHRHWCKARAEAEQAVKTATAEIVASELGIRQLASELGRALLEGE